MMILDDVAPRSVASVAR